MSKTTLRSYKLVIFTTTLIVLAKYHNCYMYYMYYNCAFNVVTIFPKTHIYLESKRREST